MSERETTILQVEPHIFVVKSYANAREANAIQAVYFKGSKVGVVNNQAQISEFNPSVTQDVEKEIIAQMVVSFNGDETNIVERCLDLPNEVYRNLVSQLDGIVSQKKT